MGRMKCLKRSIGRLLRNIVAELTLQQCRGRIKRRGRTVDSQESAQPVYLSPIHVDRATHSRVTNYVGRSEHYRDDHDDYVNAYHIRLSAAHNQQPQQLQNLSIYTPRVEVRSDESHKHHLGVSSLQQDGHQAHRLSTSSSMSKASQVSCSSSSVSSNWGSRAGPSSGLAPHSEASAALEEHEQNSFGGTGRGALGRLPRSKVINFSQLVSEDFKRFEQATAASSSSASFSQRLATHGRRRSHHGADCHAQPRRHSLKAVIDSRSAESRTTTNTNTTGSSNNNSASSSGSLVSSSSNHRGGAVESVSASSSALSILSLRSSARLSPLSAISSMSSDWSGRLSPATEPPQPRVHHHNHRQQHQYHHRQSQPSSTQADHKTRRRELTGRDASDWHVGAAGFAQRLGVAAAQAEPASWLQSQFNSHFAHSHSHSNLRLNAASSADFASMVHSDANPLTNSQQQAAAHNENSNSNNKNPTANNAVAAGRRNSFVPRSRTYHELTYERNTSDYLYCCDSYGAAHNHNHHQPHHLANHHHLNNHDQIPHSHQHRHSQQYDSSGDYHNQHQQEPDLQSNNVQKQQPNFYETSTPNYNFNCNFNYFTPKENKNKSKNLEQQQANLDWNKVLDDAEARIMRRHAQDSPSIDHYHRSNKRQAFSVDELAVAPQPPARKHSQSIYHHQHNNNKHQQQEQRRYDYDQQHQPRHLQHPEPFQPLDVTQLFQPLTQPEHRNQFQSHGHQYQKQAFDEIPAAPSKPPKPPVLMVNNYQVSTPVKYKLFSNQLLFERIILQASTSDLMQCLREFFRSRCQWTQSNSKLIDYQAHQAIRWLEDVDRTLITQGWQEISFLNPANIVFLYMLLRELISDKRSSPVSSRELRSIVMSSLYLAYAYMGNEISYPLQPFLEESDNHNEFWDRSLMIINKLSGHMLRLNAEPTYFAEVFFELKRFPATMILPHNLDNCMNLRSICSPSTTDESAIGSSSNGFDTFQSYSYSHSRSFSFEHDNTFNLNHNHNQHTFDNNNINVHCDSTRDANANANQQQDGVGDDEEDKENRCYLASDTPNGSSNGGRAATGEPLLSLALCPPI